MYYAEDSTIFIMQIQHYSKIKSEYQPTYDRQQKSLYHKMTAIKLPPKMEQFLNQHTLFWLPTLLTDFTSTK